MIRHAIAAVLITLSALGGIAGFLIARRGLRNVTGRRLQVVRVLLWVAVALAVAGAWIRLSAR
jgi:hypothetical protein